MNRTGWTTLGALLVGLAAGAWLADGQLPWNAASHAMAQTSVVATSTSPLPSTPPPALSQDEHRNISVYETANRSVVNIDTKTVAIDPMFMMQREAEGAGSGAVIDRDGHIITNYHVIDGAQQISVTLASNDVFPAELVGGDKEHDIAVLKINAPAEVLFPINMGASEHLRVGQRVYAVGNPFGWDGTMTTGIVSSLNRNLPSRVDGRQMKSLIQTDAAMNPGNSGGPLLDGNARMIGMCVAIASRTGQNTGIGFAIPIDRIKSIVPELISNGRIVRADIGIINVMETKDGLVIRQVAEDGPAAQAGLRGGRVVMQQLKRGGFVLAEKPVLDYSQADRVVAIDGEELRTGVQFQDKLWSHRPGDVVTLTVVRSGERVDVPVKLRAD
ncbi:S1C family serine protease [Lacipirellula limnantheis]|uniref:Serine protease HtrA n=1 Tax=Lacipirellula limnantheis TaxID=2528024 RepID=A0A517TUY2_9BACT|nr:trypsin-like peptidase domain-containing protein [Lacipirellula limnantheis]QDT72179.1 Putative serine protease HtrA [Lacipirellula limnantheis]